MQAVCFCVSGCFAMKDRFCEKPFRHHPWDWCIYLHLVVCFFLMVHVGKDSVRPMDAMGCVGNLQSRKAICKVGEPWKTQSLHMGVSTNNGTPKSSILIGFSIIGTTIFGNTRILITWIFTFPVLEIVSGIFLGWGIFFWGKKWDSSQPSSESLNFQGALYFPGESC